ncbi:MAG: MMPL family transporter, partial [Solirubrobacterales bacterium]
SKDGVATYLTGQPAAYAGLQELSKEDLERAEVTGFPIVALILLAVFGSLAAAALPLALGFVAVAITGALIFFLSQAMEMSVFVTNMASMIGIGVAVDYSLFILARFREEVRSGRTAADARAEALATSGLAVAFSGLAVVISLAGLWMIDNQSLRSMALGAMIVVAVAILTAIVLLPALIRLLGHRVEAGGAIWSGLIFLRRLTVRRRRRRGSTNPDAQAFWQRWTARVMRRPVLSVLASSAVLLTLAVPVLSLETGTGALSQFPADHDVREGAGLAAKASGGATNPVEVVVRFDSGELSEPGNRADVAALAREIGADPEVTGVAKPVVAEGSALISATTRSASDSDRAYAFVGDNKRAVAEGLASSARTISSAALIMTSVFAVFVLTGVPSIKELGLGNAVAIVIDASLVRLILVPAAMQLMGRWNWWLPGWLDRILPRLSFEAGAPKPGDPAGEPAVPSRASV